MTENNNHLKEGSKEFSFDNMDDFDTHIDLSIPNYSFVDEQVRNISEYFIEHDTNVFDMGCSTGRFLKSLNRRDDVRYVGIVIPESGKCDGIYFGIPIKSGNCYSGSIPAWFELCGIGNHHSCTVVFRGGA